MEKIAIVSRSFWPKNPAIGEALLLLSESLSQYAKPVVITQVDKDFPEVLQKEQRGQGVKFSTFSSLTNSASPIPLRIVELLIFTVFVFFSLCWHRPAKVYVATNPPIFTPLVVRWYCGLFGGKYIYHLQDIHPEATQVVTGRKNWIERLLLKIDIKTTQQATTVITLTEQMRSYITRRVGLKLPIVLLDNPSVQAAAQERGSKVERKKGFVYCGNAGRLQRIPLLLSAIERYLSEGGRLPFVFAGGGVYRDAVEKLAKKFEQVSYLGVLPADQAAQLLRGYSFGLMPIEDEVINYAFPSKSSSYVFSGCHVIAICGHETSIAKWIVENELGYVAEPDIEAVVSLFHELEGLFVPALEVDEDLFKRLTPKAHAESLEQIIRQA